MAPRLALKLLLALMLAWSAGIAAPEAAAQATANAAPQAGAAADHPAACTLPYTLPPEKLARAVRLHRERALLHFASAGWSILFLWLLLATGGVARLASVIGSSRWRQGPIFFPALLLLLALAMLPIALRQHWLSLAYGLSVQGWPSWLWDWSKSLLLELVFGALLLTILMAIIRRSPRRWWLWSWLTSLPVAALLVFASPLVLEPLFYHFEPLAQTHPLLAAQLERMSERTGADVPIERIFLMRASDKVTGVNAYVTGLGASKRVVLWDTTLAKIPADEILFTFGHESGHYRLHHIFQGLAFAAVVSFAFLWLGFYVVRWMLRRFGPQWRIASLDEPAAAAVLLLAYFCFSFLAEPIGNAFSRHIEHQADIYGQEAIHGLVADPRQTALCSFLRDGEIYLDDPNPSPILEFWTYSHPSLRHRAEFATGYDPWAPGQHPRYFAK